MEKMCRMRFDQFCFASVLVILVVVFVDGFDDTGKQKVQPVVFNFGDSLSDTGGYEAATGNIVPWPYGRVFFNQPSGRRCDGRLVLDFLCESLNTTFLRPYLESLGQDFNNGANFAIIGAGTLPRDGFNSLAIQVQQFIRFRKRSISLTRKGHGGYMGEEGFKSALYIVDIGGNDLSHAFKNLPYAEAIETVPKIIDEHRSAILKLSEQGATNFWVPNSHPMGCLPLLLANAKIVEGDLDQYGCISSLNNLVKLFNEQLRILCEELRLDLQNSTVVYLDIYSIRHDLITNPTSYGFKYATTACCGYGGLPYNMKGGDMSCGVWPYNVCQNSSKYINWDGMHYSEAANAQTAAKILTTSFSTPPVPFDFFLTHSTTSGKQGHSTM